MLSPSQSCFFQPGLYHWSQVTASKRPPANHFTYKTSPEEMQSGGITDSGLICSFYLRLEKGCKSCTSYCLLKWCLSVVAFPLPTGEQGSTKATGEQCPAWGSGPQPRRHSVQGRQQAGVLRGVWKEGWGFSSVRGLEKLGHRTGARLFPGDCGARWGQSVTAGQSTPQGLEWAFERREVFKLKRTNFSLGIL